MKVFEILFLGRDLLKVLHDNGIKTQDYTHLPIYRDYKELAAQQYKMTFIVAHLAEKYGMCERKVYKIISQLNKTAEIVQCEH